MLEIKENIVSDPHQMSNVYSLFIKLTLYSILLGLLS